MNALKNLFAICLLSNIAVGLFAQDYSNQANEQELAILNPSPYFGSGASLVDIDQDGWDDLTIVQENDSIEIYHNVDGQFELLTSPGYMNGDAKQPTWADYDNDGDLDLLVTCFVGQTRLFRNDGGWNFFDVTNQVGIPMDDGGRHFGASWCDYDKDGDIDVYLCSYNIDQINGSPNHLLRNNGNGTFSEVAAALGVENGFLLAFQSVWFDYNNDGWADLYVANDKSYMPNALFENNGDGTFTDVSEISGADIAIDCMTASVIDYDNNGDGTMTQDFIFGANDVTMISYGVTKGDWNNDGHWDFAVINAASYPSALMRSEGTDAGWVKLNLQGTVSHWEAMGTWIRYVVGEEERVMYTMSGENYICQESKSEILALGEALQVDTLEITWPSGLIETHTNIPTGTTIHAVEGETLEAQILPSEGPITLCEGASIVLSVNMEGEIDWGEFGSSSTLTVTTSGTYQATVTTPLGFEVVTNPVEVIVSEPLILNSVVTGFSCAGDSGSIVLGPETPSLIESISWNDGAYATENLENIPAGEYVYELTDVNGCTQSGSFLLTEPSPIQTDLTVMDVLCYGETTGAIEVNASGGTGALTIDQSPAGNDLPAGEYLVTVTDENGCTQALTATVGQPDPMEVSTTSTGSVDGGATGTAEIFVQGGVEPYTFLWSDGSTESLITNLNPGTVSVWVIDANGCTQFVEIDIEMLVGLDELALTSFQLYPNPNRGLVFANFPSPLNYRILDAQGREGQQGIWQPNTGLSVRSLPPGTYWLQALNAPALPPQKLMLIP